MRTGGRRRIAGERRRRGPLLVVIHTKGGNEELAERVREAVAAGWKRDDMELRA